MVTTPSESYPSQDTDGNYILLRRELGSLIFTETDRRRAHAGIRQQRDTGTFPADTIQRLWDLASDGQSHQAAYFLQQISETSLDVDR